MFAQGLEEISTVEAAGSLDSPKKVMMKGRKRGEEKRNGKREEKEEGRRKGSVIEDCSFISRLNNHTKLY